MSVYVLQLQVASALSHKIISNTTMCLSNLVGPLEEIGFYGHPMAFLAPSSYGQPHVSSSFLLKENIYIYICMYA